ncbi:hypothetical protein ACNJYD_12945 [Bradyrhizobium sp. DASA03005]|uniref:hypothetical protein n=1 Tax=Bradyrhizobium TaxID=374 RepID=UPI00155EE152|nr:MULTISPECIES: hypothetical protein [Bradyrhizobium]
MAQVASILARLLVETTPRESTTKLVAITAHGGEVTRGKLQLKLSDPLENARSDPLRLLDGQ